MQLKKCRKCFVDQVLNGILLALASSLILLQDLDRVLSVLTAILVCTSAHKTGIMAPCMSSQQQQIIDMSFRKGLLVNNRIQFWNIKISK